MPIPQVLMRNRVISIVSLALLYYLLPSSTLRCFHPPLHIFHQFEFRLIGQKNNSCINIPIVTSAALVPLSPSSGGQLTRFSSTVLLFSHLESMFSVFSFSCQLRGRAIRSWTDSWPWGIETAIIRGGRRGKERKKRKQTAMRFNYAHLAADGRPDRSSKG